MGESELVCAELGSEIDRLNAEGYRLDVIYPADDPHTAILSREGTTLRLTTRPGEPPVSDGLAPFKPGDVLTRASGGSGQGRAGMLYRDLIPGRLGGRYIASHITIPKGGPVSDWVHYHRITFQMIYVRNGWVRVVYEDQGEPFVMNPGDMVLQPPEIRHRVLESSPGLEVVEISCPSLHETFAEHELELPNGRGDPSRTWTGQSFLRHIAAQTPWADFLSGEVQETAMREATGGIAQVRTIRPRGASGLSFSPHDGELVFGFVLAGTGTLDYGDLPQIAPADSFVIPPQDGWGLKDLSPDFRLLHVTTSRLHQPAAR
jgi:quercetin dioxygenase-like cupin family protein